MTYHGLFTLASLQTSQKSESSPSASASVPAPAPASASEPTTPVEQPRHSELFAHFRNSHLAVLYRHADALYTLVTDQVFLNEPSVVWERLEDLDQGASVFVDSAFQRATPVGGDWAGWTPAPERVEDPAEYVVVPVHMSYHHLYYETAVSLHCNCRTQRTNTRVWHVPSMRSVWLRRGEMSSSSISNKAIRREKINIIKRIIVELCN